MPNVKMLNSISIRDLFVGDIFRFLAVFHQQTLSSFPSIGHQLLLQ